MIFQAYLIFKTNAEGNKNVYTPARLCLSYFQLTLNAKFINNHKLNHIFLQK